jgi:hypothetical protein
VAFENFKMAAIFKMASIILENFRIGVGVYRKWNESPSNV